MKSLTQWLREDCKAFDVRPILLTIAGEVWHAAFYRQTFEYQSGMDAVSRGEKKAGDKYTEEGIYAIGNLPKSYDTRKTEAKVCYPWQNVDWYIAGYLPTTTAREIINEYHPFGVNFILRPWSVPSGEKIDHYSSKPYERIEMKVEDVAEATVADTPAKIEAFMLLRLKGALWLEVKGMKCRGRSAYAMVKQKYGFKGNKARVYDQFVAKLQADGILV